MSDTAPLSCSRCKHFVDDPHELEKLFTGVNILSSTYGSTRGDSGICRLQDTFQLPVYVCDKFEERS